MAVELIGEPLTGTVDGNNRAFATSEVPNPNTIAIYDDMVLAAVESVDATGKIFTLVTAPAVGSQVFGTYLYSAAADIDLTTLAAVKAMAEVTSAKEDGEIQDLITSFSQWAINYTSNRALSRVLTITDDDPYDGPGGARLYLRNFPIISLQAVTVNGIALPIATGRTGGGVLIVDQGRGLALRPPLGGGYSSFTSYPAAGPLGAFLRGIANIYVDYTAGNNGAPADLEMAARTECAIAYKRKLTLDLKSKSVNVAGGSGTTTYRDWDITPRTQKVLDRYKRWTFAA